jgi:hypothetical protein
MTHKPAVGLGGSGRKQFSNLIDYGPYIGSAPRHQARKHRRPRQPDCGGLRLPFTASAPVRSTNTCLK